MIAAARGDVPPHFIGGHSVPAAGGATVEGGTRAGESPGANAGRVRAGRDGANRSHESCAEMRFVAIPPIPRRNERT